jgi:hypothetical protein
MDFEKLLDLALLIGVFYIVGLIIYASWIYNPFLGVYALFYFLTR